VKALRVIDNLGAWACFFIACWAAWHAWGYVPLFWISIVFMVIISIGASNPIKENP
jgi:hypothetical protein